MRRREGGREGEVILRVWENVVATEGMLGDLNPLGDGPCRSLADHGAMIGTFITSEGECLKNL